MKTTEKGRWYVVSTPNQVADLWRGWAKNAADAYNLAAPALEQLARTSTKPLPISVRRSQNHDVLDAISAVLHPGETLTDLTDHKRDVLRAERDAADQLRDQRRAVDVKIKELEAAGLIEKCADNISYYYFYMDSSGQAWTLTPKGLEQQKAEQAVIYKAWAGNPRRLRKWRNRTPNHWNLKDSECKYPDPVKGIDFGITLSDVDDWYNEQAGRP